MRAHVHTSTVITALCSMLFACCVFFVFTSSAEAALTDGLVGHWTFDTMKMNPNVRDKSTSGNHGTLQNFVATTTVVGQVRQALLFDGSDDYVDMGTTAVLNPTAAMTISAWVKPQSGGPALYSIVTRNQNGGSRAYEFYLRPANLQAELYINGTLLVTGPALTADVWTHITVTVNSTQSVMYINGAQYVTGSGATINSVTDQTMVGGRDDTTFEFKGTLDDVRMYNRVLGASEAVSVYRYRSGETSINTTNTAIPDLKRGKVAHWTFDGKHLGPNVRDVSGQGNHGILSGFTSTTTRPGRVGQALSFDGVNDYVDVTAMNQTPTSYTTSLWVYESSRQNGGGNGANGHMLFYVNTSFAEVSSDNGVIYFAGAGGSWKSTGYTLPLQKWVHLSFVTTASTLKMYVNGSEVYSTATDNFVALTTMRLGSWAGSNGFFHGAMDDFRIHNRALSATEAKLLYTSTLPTKTNVSVPLRNMGTGGLVGHWTFDGKHMYPNVRDASGVGNHGTLSGFTSTTTRPGKVGQALSFDGVNDEVSIDSISTALASGAFSTSLWFKPATTFTGSARQLLFTNGTLSSDNDIRICLGGTPSDSCNSPTGQLCLGVYTGSGWGNACSAQTTWVGGVWVHVVVTFSTTNGQVIYVNGTSAGTHANTSRGSSMSTEAAIGASTNSADDPFAGQIDDVRVFTRALSSKEAKLLYSSARSFAR